MITPIDVDDAPTDDDCVDELQALVAAQAELIAAQDAQTDAVAALSRAIHESQLQRMSTSSSPS